jgi:hypothetical protein
MPAHLKAASEARKATDAEAKLKNEISKNEKILANKEASINDKNTAARDLIGLRGKLIAATKKKEAAIAKKERADIEAGIAVGGATTTDTSDAASSTPSAPAPTSGEPIPDAPVNNDPIDATGPRNSNSSGKERGVLPEVLAKLNQVSSRVGKKLVVTSGYRPGVPNHGERKAVDLGFGPNKLSQEEINKVFTAAIDVGFTGIGAEFRARGGAHIHLDTSHPTLVGWGSDTRSSSTRQDSPFLANLIEQRRSGRPAAPNQNSARTGGIFSGPDSGYLTQLHGDEIVAPVGKQALNTSMIGGLTNNEASDAEFSSVYNELEDKLDRLITIMGDTAKATKKQSMAKFV